MQLLQSSLPWIQVVLAVLLIGLIMLQQSEGSLGAAFGGSGNEATFRTKRGAEKVIFNATIVLSLLFVIASIASLVLK